MLTPETTPYDTLTRDRPNVSFFAKPQYNITLNSTSNVLAIQVLNSPDEYSGGSGPAAPL